jgi:hypothetical protein
MRNLPRDDKGGAGGFLRRAAAGIGMTSRPFRDYLLVGWIPQDFILGYFQSSLRDWVPFGNCRSLGFPGFPVKLGGVDKLHAGLSRVAK